MGVDPLTADLRLAAKDADLAPYQAYLPTAARIGGWADLDLAVVLPELSVGRARRSHSSPRHPPCGGRGLRDR